jgi:Sulfotransferase domain.
MSSPENSPRNVFFACGAPKSGTTWLQRVLDAHPEVVCSGEGHFIDQFSTPLAQVVRNYNQKLQLVNRRVYEGKPYYSPIDQSEFDDLVRIFIRRRMEARATDPRVRWIGDKTPAYATYLKRLTGLFPEAKFFEIIRDPRDAAVSRLYHARRAGLPHADAPHTPEALEFFRAGAQQWRSNVAPVREFARQHPGRLITVLYETMIDDPAGEARRLFGFLGVSCDDAVIGQVTGASSFEALTGRKRGQEDPNSFVRKGVVGDWVGKLPQPALDAIEEVCGPLMRELGYAKA